MDEAPVVDPNAPTDGAPAERKGMPGWAKALLILAGLLVLVGIGLSLFESDPPKQAGTQNLPGGASALTAQGADGTTAGSADSWAPGFLKMGFSFFVGFALGYAARKFLKVGLVVCGVLFALMFLGNHLGWVEVHWDAMKQTFDNLTGGMGAQFESVKAFVTGSLPAAGLASLGLFAGFKAG